MPNILIVTEDALGERMAGPAIRAWNIAQALSELAVVMLATTSVCERQSSRFSTEACGELRLAELSDWCDVMIVQGFVLEHVASLQSTDKVLVVDLYDPLHFEALELNRARPEPERSRNISWSVGVVRDQLLRGDYFICASERQRDLWLGALACLGRLNPATYAQDPTFRHLIEVVPFGLPDEPPAHGGEPVLRGVVDGIGPCDAIVLWGGGVYDWLDPVTLIQAVDALRSRLPTVRVFFLGTSHPNPAVGEPASLADARLVARNLGIEGSHVFFNDGWVRYEDRHRYLIEADVGVSLHRDHLETAYSFRTRVLDYLWAGLPIVTTAGDSFADLVSSEGLGRVVRQGDTSAVEQALYELLSNEEERSACADRARQVGRRFRWSEALGPLVDFCSDPRPAADQPEWLGSAAMAEPEALRLAAERLERLAPGYLQHARERAASLGLQEGARAEVAAALEDIDAAAGFKVDSPVIAGSAPARAVKVGVRRLVGWYIRQLAERLEAFAHAVSRLGVSLSRSSEELEARLAQLEERMNRLEEEGSSD